MNNISFTILEKWNDGNMEKSPKLSAQYSNFPTFHLAFGIEVFIFSNS